MIIRTKVRIVKLTEGRDDIKYKVMGLEGKEGGRDAAREALLRQAEEITGGATAPEPQPDDKSSIDRVPGVFTLLDILKQKILKSLWGFLDIAELRDTQVFNRLEEDLDTALKQHTAATPVDAIQYLGGDHMELSRPLIQKLIDLYTLRAQTELRTGIIVEPAQYAIAAIQLCIIMALPVTEALTELIEEIAIKIPTESPLRRILYYLRTATIHFRARPLVSLENLINTSRAAEARGDIEAVLELEMEIVRMKPTSIIGRHRCVEFLIKLGRLREAECFLYETERLIHGLAARDAENIGALWDAIEEGILEGNPRPSVDNYRLITDNERRKASLRMLKQYANKARNEKDYAGAIPFSKIIAERMPDNFSAQDRLARDYQFAEDFVEAIRAREKMVEHWSNDPEAVRRLEDVRSQWRETETNIPAQRERFKRFLDRLLESAQQWEFPEGKGDPYRKIPEGDLEYWKGKFAEYEDFFVRRDIFPEEQFRQLWRVFKQLKEQVAIGYINVMTIRNLLMRIEE